MSVNEGVNAKKILKSGGVTQQQLADHLGKDRTFVTRLLSESSIRPEVKEAISILLGIDADDLEKKLKVKEELSDYVKSLEAQLADKERIILAQESELKLWRKLEKEREKNE